MFKKSLTTAFISAIATFNLLAIDTIIPAIKTPAATINCMLNTKCVDPELDLSLEGINSAVNLYVSTYFHDMDSLATAFTQLEFDINQLKLKKLLNNERLRTIKGSMLLELRNQGILDRMVQRVDKKSKIGGAALGILAVWAIQLMYPYKIKIQDTNISSLKKVITETKIPLRERSPVSLLRRFIINPSIGAAAGTTIVNQASEVMIKSDVEEMQKEIQQLGR
jgi:hypothetical protein